MKIRGIIAAALALTLLLCGCGREIAPPDIVSAAPEYDLPPVKPAYPAGFDNETFDASPASVASLSPALTDIIFDIGMSGRLVAVSDYCDRPDAENIPRAGSPARPDIDALVAAAPELLVTQSPIAATDVLTLKNAGIRVLSLSLPDSYASLCELYLKLATVFYGAAECDSVAAGALSLLDSAMLSAQELQKPAGSFVIVEAYADGGLMLSTGRTLCSDMLSVFGENLREYAGDYFTSDEELFDIAPDTVFYSDDMDENDVEEVFPHSKLIPIDMTLFERGTASLAGVISECEEKLK